MKRVMTCLLGAGLLVSLVSVTLTGCDEKGKCGCRKGKCTCPKPAVKAPDCKCPKEKCTCKPGAPMVNCKCPKGKCACPKPAPKVKKAVKSCGPCGG